MGVEQDLIVGVTFTLIGVAIALFAPSSAGGGSAAGLAELALL